MILKILTSIFITIMLIDASLSACVGPKCPLYMAPLGDSGDFDKSIIECNNNALPGLQFGNYGNGKNEYCKSIYNQWLTSPARDKYIKDKIEEANQKIKELSK